MAHHLLPHLAPGTGLMEVVLNAVGQHEAGQLLGSSEAKLAVVLWVLAGAAPGPLEADGVVAARDVLKALRALKWVLGQCGRVWRCALCAVGRGVLWL